MFGGWRQCLRYHINPHHKSVLTCFLGESGGAEEDDNYVGAEDHGEELGLEDCEVEAGDDYVGEGAEAAGWEGGAYYNLWFDFRY